MKKIITPATRTAVFTTWLLLFHTLTSLGNDRDTLYPVVGKPCPYFRLTGVGNFPKSVVTPEDFQGKWLIMDFWSLGCSACVNAMPRINHIQQRFRDQVQYLVVGVTDRENRITSVYEKYRKGLGLQMAYAFDSALNKQFDIGGFPFTVLVDPKGIVRYITIHANEKEIGDILAGKPVELEDGYFEHIPRKAREKVAFLSGTGHDSGNEQQIAFCSMFYKWRPNMQLQASPVYPVAVNREGCFEITGGLRRTYMAAYLGHGDVGWGDVLYGKFYGTPVLEGVDADEFGPHMGGEIKYGYRLKVPPSDTSRAQLMAYLQQDLKRFYGYDAVIETRTMPYWRLVATPEARLKLRTKGGREEMIGRIDTGFVMRNIPVSCLIDRRLFHFGIDYSTDFVIDETGIEGNIDITMSGMMINFETIRRALRANGLDLVEGKKEMKVLVIRPGSHKKMD